MLEGTQAGRVEASCPKGNKNVLSLGGSDGVPPGRQSPRSRQVACSPVSPHHVPLCLHGERSFHLPNLDAAEGRI